MNKEKLIEAAEKEYPIGNMPKGLLFYTYTDKINYERAAFLRGLSYRQDLIGDAFDAGYDYRSSLLPGIIEQFGENSKPNKTEFLTLLNCIPDMDGEVKVLRDALEKIRDFDSECKLPYKQVVSGACAIACGANSAICYATCHMAQCAVCTLAYQRCMANCPD